MSVLPDVRFAKRLDASPRRTTLVRLGGGIVALLIAGLILQVTGRDALHLGRAAWQQSFGSRSNFFQMAALATPILMAAISVTFAFRARLWNLGVDGQLLMGAWAATGVGLHVDGPEPLVLLLMALASMVGGALWILVPALLRIRLGMSEVITTLLLNFIAEYWVVWFATDVWRASGSGAVTNSSERVEADLPLVFGSTTLHIGFVLPLVLIVLFGLAFRFTRWGLEVDMTGGNPRAAEVAGLPVQRRLLGTLLVSGAIAGLGGMLQVAGTAHSLSASVSNNYGFTGFIVAALAAGSAVGLLFVGVFLAFLARAGIALQTQGLSTDVVLAINGAILMAVGLADVAAGQRLVLGRGRRGERPMPPGGGPEPPPEDQPMGATGDPLVDAEAVSSTAPSLTKASPRPPGEEPT